MKFHIQNLKFRFQIILLFSIMFLLMSSGSGIAFYHLSARSVEDNFIKSAENSMRQIGDTLDTRLGIISGKARSMLINSTFYNILEQMLNDPSIANVVKAQGVSSDYLKDFERGESLISSSYLYTDIEEFYGYVHYKRQDFIFYESPFYQIYQENPMQAIQWFPPMSDIVFNSNKTVLPCVQRFTVGGYSGYLYFVYQLDVAELKDLLSGQQPFFDDIVIMDANGNQILGDHQLEVYTDDEYLVESCKAFSGQWSVYGIKSRIELLESLKELRMQIIKIAMILLLTGILLVIWISKHMTDALSRMEKSMLYAQNGDLSVRFFYPYKNEIGTLSKSFNYMLNELQSLVVKQENMIEALRIEKDRVEEVQKQKRKAELKALQAQINPHFLYNTLNMITWQAADKGLEEVSLMASSLGRFFRLSLSRGAEVITLADEVEHVRSYLNIQGVRYQDKLSYQIELNEEDREYRVPKLILQPLVENSIYHGIKEKKDGGQIRIIVERGRRNGVNVLLLQVWDDGIGIAEEKLKHMNQALRKGTCSHSDGYGIYNVNERIMLYYGKEYGLFYESQVEHYTSAVVILPIEYVEAEEHV